MTPKGNVLVLGASSSVARCLAAELARRGYGLVLASRDLEDARATAADLEVRFSARTAAVSFDALDETRHDAVLDEAASALPGGITGVVLAFAVMPPQNEVERDAGARRLLLDTNVVATFSLLERAAARLEAVGGGFLCALSSVAADRGRASLYLYGATKAALSSYLAGLRHRLRPAGVLVVDVRPGVVDTPMTYGLGVPKALAASPETVARDIAVAIERGKHVLYTPWIWRWIMLAIRLIPEPVFLRLKL